MCVRKRSTIVVLQPAGPSRGHCLGLSVTQQAGLLLVLTLRGPSGGHCVELEGGAPQMGEARHTLGPFGLPACQAFLYVEAPRSGPRRAPEGQCEEKREMVCNTTFDNRFRTSDRHEEHALHCTILIGIHTMESSHQHYQDLT